MKKPVSVSPRLRVSVSAPRRVRFVLENVSEGDARFLGDVIALFADPALAGRLRELQSGQAVLHYGPRGHGLCCAVWGRS